MEARRKSITTDTNVPFVRKPRIKLENQGCTLSRRCLCRICVFLARESYTTCSLKGRSLRASLDSTQTSFSHPSRFPASSMLHVCDGGNDNDDEDDSPTTSREGSVSSDQAMPLPPLPTFFPRNEPCRAVIHRFTRDFDTVTRVLAQTVRACSYRIEKPWCRRLTDNRPRYDVVAVVARS